MEGTVHGLRREERGGRRREVYDGEGNELRRRAKKEGKEYETAEE